MNKKIELHKYGYTIARAMLESKGITLTDNTKIRTRRKNVKYKAFSLNPDDAKEIERSDRFFILSVPDEQGSIDLYEFDENSYYETKTFREDNKCRTLRFYDINRKTPISTIVNDKIRDKLISLSPSNY